MAGLNTLDEIIRQLRRRLRLLDLQDSHGSVKTGDASERPTEVTVSQGKTVMFYANDTKTLSIWNTQTGEWDESVFT